MTEAAPQQAEEEHAHHAHVQREQARLIFWVGSGFVVVVALVTFGLLWLYLQ